MTLATNSEIDYFGSGGNTLVTAGGGTSSVANNAFSVSGDIQTWTNSEDARQAMMLLTCAFATAPTAGSGINVFARLLNIDSTNDADTPTTNFRHYLIGTFPVKDTTSTQRIPITVFLPNFKTGQEYEFYFQCANTTNTMSAGWTVYIATKAAGLKA